MSTRRSPSFKVCPYCGDQKSATRKGLKKQNRDSLAAQSHQGRIHPMARRYSAVIVSLVLVVLQAVSSQAQSGRGRQLRIQGTLRIESVAPQAIESSADQKIDSAVSAGEPVLSRRTKGWVDNEGAANQKKDDGE